jgi:UDP-3-O-[3-hydroxymyristoyl] glucosamine N-acyltransferase
VTVKLSEIGALLGGEVAGDGSIEITRVAKIEDAGPGEISFVANPKYRKYLASTAASAILVAKAEIFDELRLRASPLTLVRVDDPYMAFLRLIDRFHPPSKPLAKGIHPTAQIAAGASIGRDAAIGAFVVVGERTSIGEGTALYPGTVLGDDVAVGRNTVIHAHVAIREQCRIGDRVIIHSGTVIGSDGFGFAPTGEGEYEKIPQRGIVVIGDDVEIGANCAIDRATIGETRIEEGAKLDNLIQIAHNVVVGAHTVIAGQTGISGSTKLGKYCMVGGQAGFAGHLTIADKSNFGAQSGIPKSITESGKTYFGTPILELRETLRIEASLRQLPGLLVEVRKLSERVKELEEQIARHNQEPQKH